MAREYKDSGIEWIGDVPTHWKVMPLKRTGSFENGLTYSPADICDENGVLVLRSSNIQNDKLNFEDKVYVAKCPLSLLVHSGDIVICSRNGSASLVGKCAMIEGNINATYGAFMMRYRPNYKSNKAFSFYLLQTALQCYKGLYSTTTINQLTKGVIGQIYVSYPPLSEQRAIASYLDTKCAEIDSLIELQEQMIAQLTDYKQSVITEAVTKGLNPEAELVSSGIDWIGDYPKHWEIIKIGFIFDNLDYLREPISAELRERNNPQYDYYGASGVIDKIDHYNVDDKVLLIGEDGANLVMRNLPLIYKAEGKFWVNNHAHILKPKKDDYDYLAHALEAANYRNYITGSAQPKLSQENLQAVKLPIPPLAEQQAIASYLDTKCHEIDSLISLKRQKIETLKDYKKSIIFEAVTGKTDLESLALIGRNHWH